MSQYLPFNSQNGIIKKHYTSLINNSLKISHRILFQCSAVSKNFLAIGCNTGNIYIFNIQYSKFKYWSNIITNDSSVSGIQFSPSKHYLAYHNKKFQIIIYKLNLVNEKNLMIRLIDGSQNSPIQSLVWDDECSKIFCGFTNGYIDVIYVPQNQTKDYFQGPSEGLLKLDRQDIVQLDLMRDLLLVSTNERVVLLNTQSKFMTLIGTKPRSGQFGACFWYDSSKQLRIVSARPGYRLWIALVDGTVEETQQYKTWNNSVKFKISDTDSSPTGSGQYVFLANIKKSNLLVAIENDGLLFLIDLIKKSCLAVVDYGTNLSRILCNSDGIIFNSQREVVYLSVSTFKDALKNLLDEDIDPKYVIDLLLDVMRFPDDLDNVDNVDNASSIRQLSLTLSPDLLSRIVQKSAEIGYRFSDTNKLQVFIEDNDEYQVAFHSIRSSDQNLPKPSSASMDLQDDGSTESDCSIDQTKRTQKNTKRKGFVKTPQLLQTIYDKTSTFLANIDVLSSSNSDIHINVNDSFSDPYYRDDYQEGTSLQEVPNRIPENVTANINLMELEANGYIASEKYKQRDVDAESRNDFIDSLSNFCEAWLRLNVQHWRRLQDFELYIRNLSATFLILTSKASVSSNDESSQSHGDESFILDQLNAQFANSWSMTINTVDWMKPLPIPEKINTMTCTLVSHCFIYETFERYPALIEKMNDLTRRITYSEEPATSSVDTCVNVNSEERFDRATQITESRTEVSVVEYVASNRYIPLINILSKEIWSQTTDFTWISSIVKHFHDFLNIKSIRQWLRSGVSYQVWSVALNAYRDVCTVISKRDDNLIDRSHADLEKILFDALCADTVYSFVVVDEILSVMKDLDIINWRLLIESENFDCRDVLYFSWKYDLDLTDYVLYLFKYVHLSISFSTRYSLMEHIYSQSDVVISFIYALLLNKSSSGKSQQNCDCGLLIRYSEVVAPDNVNSLVIEILKWGAEQGIFKKNSQLLTILMKLCFDAGYHQGYIELLVGMSSVKDLVRIGIQVADAEVLGRIKDCSVSSLDSMVEVIELILDCRRKQTKEPGTIRCVACDEPIDCEAGTCPLSWTELGRLVLSTLIGDYNYVEVLHKVLPLLSGDEMTEMKALLTNSLETILGQRRVLERHQMSKFIRTEMTTMTTTSATSDNDDTGNGDITEKYLNIYTMTRQELSGDNWGRIITSNMHCDLCGTKLMVANRDNDNDNKEQTYSQEIIAFCCQHTFHRQCFLQFGFSDNCFLC